MPRRSIVVVIDGLGIGAMDDAQNFNSGDEKANTLKSILTKLTFSQLPNLQALGLEDLFFQTAKRKLNSKISRCRLNYYGADSYLGHQEINGSKVPMPYFSPVSQYYPAIEKALVKKGFKVSYLPKENLKTMLVNNHVLITDNIETRLGQVINVNTSFDEISYEKELKIGDIVRQIVQVTRVIVLGAHQIKLQDFVKNLKVIDGKYLGVDTPKSGVYNSTYLCKHLGLPIDTTNQIPMVLEKHQINSYLVAKYGDLIKNPHLENSFNLSNTDQIIQKTLTLLDQTKKETCFIGVNIQESDLAGHSMDVKRYAQVLIKVDFMLGEILKKLQPNDLLIVTADHGNDPLIGHSNHTREMVPLLIYSSNFTTQTLEKDKPSLNEIAKVVKTWMIENK